MSWRTQANDGPGLLGLVEAGGPGLERSRRRRAMWRNWCLFCARNWPFERKGAAHSRAVEAAIKDVLGRVRR